MKIFKVGPPSSQQSIAATIQDYEQELLSEKAQLEHELKDSGKIGDQLRQKCQKLEGEKAQFKKEVRDLEHEIEGLENALEKTKSSNQRIVQLELQNEELVSENRNVGFMYEDLEMKFD